MTFSLTGKTAIITGAANGVGLAIARHFVSQGANVVCADIDEAHLKQEWGDSIDEDTGTSEGGVRIFAGDLREKLTIANLLSATIDAFENVDILVNASRQVCRCEPLDPDDQVVQVLLDQNLMTGLRLSQLVAKRMIQQKKNIEGKTETQKFGQKFGTIINLSSIASSQSSPDLLAFSIASAAVNQMTRSLAIALAPEKVLVNAVEFGSVMSASLKNHIDDQPEIRDQIIGGTPLDEIADPLQVAQAVHYLASDAAGFMTGHVLTVDGGRSLLDVVQNCAH